MNAPALTSFINPAQFISAVKRLPSLPSVATDLILSLESETVVAGDLAQKISLDPGLSASTLRLANSSFYGLPGKVGTLGDAIMVLGLRQLRTLVVTAAVVGRLPAPPRAVFNIDAFWRHSLATALTARQLAKEIGVNGELAYMTGLLHDIGRLALASCFPVAYGAASEYRRRHDCFTAESERDVLGMDHTTAGRLMTEHWRFPVSIQEGVAAHHDPESEAANSMAGLVHVANVLAHGLDLSQDPDDLVPPLNSVAWFRLGLDWERLKHLLPIIVELHGELNELLSNP